mgnify:CR=1 FL=1
MLVINPSETPIPQLHQFLIGSVGPRPICFASTISKDGKPNLAPFSFFNVFSANPPILAFAPNNSGRTGEPKDTLLNVLEVPQVVINVVSNAIVEKMNVAAAPWEKGISEFDKAGFTALESDLIAPFRVAESPVQIECEVIEVKHFGQGGGAGNMVICKVLRLHINENVLNEEGKIDQHKIDLVGRLGGSWYTYSDLFQLGQPMSPTIGFDQLPETVKNSKSLTANEVGKMAALAEWPSPETIAEAKLLKVDSRDQTASQLISDGKISLALAIYLI